jgi:hypothetical protein
MTIDMKMLKIAQNPKTPSKVLARLFDTFVVPNEWSPYRQYSTSTQTIRPKRVISVLLRNPNLPKSVVAHYVEKNLDVYFSTEKEVDYEFLKEIVSAQELPDNQLEKILSFDISNSYSREELVKGLIESPKVKIHVKYNAAMKGNLLAQGYLFGDGFEEFSTYLIEEGILGEVDSGALPRQWIQKILGWDEAYAYAY